jgi:hypothetical protein
MRGTMNLSRRVFWALSYLTIAVDHTSGHLVWAAGGRDEKNGI